MRNVGQEAESRSHFAPSPRQAEGEGARPNLCGIVYRSQAMHDAVTLALHVAVSDVPVLISGPNGSGKEKLAEIVQANSRRREQAFVRLNAGALPDELLEAELFGAEVGAYTGAQRLRVGRFEAAHAGTLFLDELGNLSMAGQIKLLRVLQTGEYERLGSSHTRSADVRLISATNADLRREIQAGRFREDLYFRLNVIELVVPPLAERVEDVLPLAEHFLRVHAPAERRVALTSSAAQALEQHAWPGNVRELENRIQRALLVTHAETIAPADLGFGVAAPAALRKPPVARPAADSAGAERRSVEGALLRARGVVSRAAAELGVSRQALYRMMDRLGIELERRPIPAAACAGSSTLHWQARS